MEGQEMKAKDMNLGNAIHHFRNKKGLSLRKLEEMTGVSASYIYRLEEGYKKNPSVHTVKKLSIALDVELYDYVEVKHEKELKSEEIKE